MSDKMEKYRDKHAEVTALEHVDETEYCFRAGFDAAIALDLPVKFIDWYEQTDLDEFLRIILPSKGHVATNKEIYQYWIDNIYKPE